MGKEDYKTRRVHRFNKEIINSELLGDVMYMSYRDLLPQELLHVPESKVRGQEKRC